MCTMTSNQRSACAACHTRDALQTNWRGAVQMRLIASVCMTSALAPELHAQPLCCKLCCGTFGGQRSKNLATNIAGPARRPGAGTKGCNTATTWILEATTAILRSCCDRACWLKKASWQRDVSKLAGSTKLKADKLKPSSLARKA